MLRFLVHLVMTKLHQPPSYLEMYLAMSCDLIPSHNPDASIPVGYEQPRTPQATSCDQPPSHGTQDQGDSSEPAKMAEL